MLVLCWAREGLDWLSVAANTLIRAVRNIFFFSFKVLIFLFPLHDVSPLFLWSGVGEEGRVWVLDEYLLREETIIDFVLNTLSSAREIVLLFLTVDWRAKPGERKLLLLLGRLLVLMVYMLVEMKRLDG